MMKLSVKAGMAAIASLLVIQCTIAQKTATSDKMDWWKKARFGMFIHWGVYAVPAGVRNGKNVDGLGEWIMQDAHIPREEYAGFAKQFNPDKYDPEAWVRMAQEAGMKYIVITSKHHDGFAMFDTKASDWSIMKAAPYGKDLLKPLAEACRRHGIKLGLYYSQANDWYNPGGAAAFGQWDSTQRGSMDEYIDKVAVPQVREILSKYGDIAELWWDVPTGMTHERAAKLDAVVKELQPDIITNDRLGADFKGDITTPEQYIPATGIKDRNWETCMTMNDTWGYKSTDHNWKSSTELIRNLVDIASKGGNYLLNVGPDASGVFPAPIQERLKDIGTWMKINGEAIYGTSASPFKKLPWGRCTQRTNDKGTTLFLHVFQWPANGVLEVPGLKSTVTSAQMLATGKKLTCRQTASGYDIVLPGVTADQPVSVIRLKTTGSLEVVDISVLPAVDGRLVLEAGMADMHNETKGGSVRVEGGEEQNIGYWTEASDWISWNVHFAKPGTYQVKAEASTPADNSAFVWGAGKQEKEGFVHYTGDYNVYETFDLGTIVVEQAGDQLFYIKPSSANWQAINLKRITIAPLTK